MFLGFGEVMMRIAPEHKLRLRQVLPGRVEITWFVVSCLTTQEK